MQILVTAWRLDPSIVSIAERCQTSFLYTDPTVGLQKTCQTSRDGLTVPQVSSQRSSMTHWQGYFGLLHDTNTQMHMANRSKHVSLKRNQMVNAHLFKFNDKDGRNLVLHRMSSSVSELLTDLYLPLSRLVRTAVGPPRLCYIECTHLANEMRLQKWTNPPPVILRLTYRRFVDCKRLDKVQEPTLVRF